MKIAVIGSRKFKNLKLVYKYIMELPADTVMISGGAIGVDYMAELTAKSRGLKVITHLPDYINYSPLVAPLIRNQLIIEECDQVTAFWNGKSTGTINALSIAKSLNKPITIISDER